MLFIKDKSNIEALLGEVATLKANDGITILNQLIVRYPKATPPLEEKMKLQLSSKNWSLALDTASRILSLQANNLSALQVNRYIENITSMLTSNPWNMKYSHGVVRDHFNL